jgi:hypothetical protein
MGSTLVAKINTGQWGGHVHSYRIFLARIEAVFAVLTGTLGVITIFWHDWIEILTGWDPDHHSGSLEAGLIVALFAVSVTCAVLARRTYGRIPAPSS